MWILTILLLFADGSVEMVSTAHGSAINGDRCFIAAQQAMKLQDVGLHVLSATCARTRAT